jgi:gamma-tubulin complex component 3
MKIYLHRLVKTLVPADLGEEYVDTVFQELLHHIEQGSNHRSNYDIRGLLSDMKPEISSSTFPQVEKVIEQLLRLKGPNTVAQYLVLISGLMESRPVNRDSESDRRSFVDDTRSLSNYGHTVDSFENTNIERFSDRRSVYSTTLNEPRSLTMEDMLIPYLEGQVPEREILSYLSYTMMGTTSDLLPLNDGMVALPNNMSNGLSGLLHLTLESGLIYQILSKLTDKLKSKNVSQVHVALASFISDQLSEYVQLVNDLSTKQNFTLKSIYADVSDSLVKLRFLYFVFKRSSLLPSYDVLSFVYTYHEHGDFVIQTCARGMLDYLLEPFLNSLSEWVVNGQLGNSSGFFLSHTKSISLTLDNFMDIKFYPERVPSFIDSELSKKIYTIGITNVFLKFQCKETRWSNDFAQKTGFFLQNIRSNSNSFIKESRFHTFIANTYDEILNYLTFTLHNKFHLMKTMHALCDYLLMSRGDFIQCLLEKASDLLNEPSSSLTGHQLTRLLQESVLHTTSRYDLNQSDDNLILNNLDARLLDIGHGNIGWDVFTLDYRVDPPLNYLLNDQSNQYKKEYLRVFNHLWKIKRLRQLFGDEWKNAKKIRIRERRFTRIRLIHNFIQGFVQSIEGFTFYEIVDKSRTKLSAMFEQSNGKNVHQVTSTKLKISPKVLKPSLDFLKRINGIDKSFSKLDNEFLELPISEIQSIHSEFLLSITKHKLMDGSSSESRGKVSNKFYINQINSLINIAFRFVVSEREITQIMTEGNSSYRNDNDQARMDVICDNLLMLFNEFNENLKTLVADLNNDGDLQLRYLGVSLNQ